MIRNDIKVTNYLRNEKELKYKQDMLKPRDFQLLVIFTKFFFLCSKDYFIKVWQQICSILRFLEKSLKNQQNNLKFKNQQMIFQKC
jgi:hypothetical protein